MDIWRHIQSLLVFYCASPLPSHMTQGLHRMVCIWHYIPSQTAQPHGRYTDTLTLIPWHWVNFSWQYRLGPSILTNGLLVLTLVTNNVDEFISSICRSHSGQLAQHLHLVKACQNKYNKNIKILFVFVVPLFNINCWTICTDHHRFSSLN